MNLPAILYGLIPGVLCYRLTVVAPFRRYVPLGQRFCMKWFIWAFFFVLIALQWIPVAGAVVIPLMALTSYTAYRVGFASGLTET